MFSSDECALLFIDYYKKNTSMSSTNTVLNKRGGTIWTKEEVRFLEQRLLFYKEKRSWSIITQEFSHSKFSYRTYDQIRGKAMREEKSRRRLNLPLGGYKYASLLYNF